MAKYFDAHLYLANWGTRELMLRFPRSVLDPATAALYCNHEHASVDVSGDFVVLTFHSESEDSYWEDGGGWLSRIIGVREGIAGGDHRALYIAWLLGVQDVDPDEDDEYDEEDESERDGTEPPVPPGLKKLNGPLEALRDFLRIDDDLLAAAAERSPAPEPEAAREELDAWVAALPDAEKTALLQRIAGDEPVAVRAELLRRFRLGRRGEPAKATETEAPRTAAELLAAAERRAKERKRAEAERAAAQRSRFLDELATREDATWRRVDTLIATKQPKAYDEAVALLRDLRDLAARDGRAAEAEARLQALREAHARKPGLLQRLGRIGAGKSSR